MTEIHVEPVVNVPEAVVNVTETSDVLPPRIRWGAIFGGSIAALGLWALLYALGLALGLSAIDPHEPSSLRSSGIFTGIWGVVTPLIALFVGGLVASRLAGVVMKGLAAAHGLVMWGLTTLLGAWVFASIAATLAGGALSVGRATLEASGAVGQAVAAPAGAVARTIALDVDDALAPVNRRLTAEGKPPVTAAQLQGAVGDIVRSAVVQGRVDRATLVNAITQNTALSGAEASDVAARIEAQVAQAKQGLSGAAQQVQTKALEAAETTGKAFWGVFGALFFGLLAALGGAVLGASYRMQDWAERARVKAIHHRTLATSH